VDADAALMGTYHEHPRFRRNARMTD